MEKRTPKKRDSEISELRQEMRQGFLQTKQEMLVAIKATKQETMDVINTSNQELLETMNTFATHVEENFALVKQDIAILKNDVSGLKSEMGAVKASMVTKSYLDDKLACFYGDAVAMVRKEDTKVDNLTGILATKKVLSKTEAKEVVHMGPFPKA